MNPGLRNAACDAFLLATSESEYMPRSTWSARSARPLALSVTDHYRPSKNDRTVSMTLPRSAGAMP